MALLNFTRRLTRQSIVLNSDHIIAVERPGDFARLTVAEVGFVDVDVDPAALNDALDALEMPTAKPERKEHGQQAAKSSCG